MKDLIKLSSKTVIGERHFYQSRKEEWFERDHTNDAGAGKQSEKGGEKAMLQLYRRQLHPAGRAEPCPCPQLITRSLICRWFLTAVLPGEKELKQELIRKGERKRCEVCGHTYYSASNRSKYCADCAAKVKRRQQAEYARRKRASVEK